MSERKADVIIFGAGIAGLWTFHRLTRLGYDVLLLESNAVGGGQSVASQGIIHSGLKYALASRVSSIAENIRAMPQRWRDALAGSGDVDLTGARIAAESQQLLIPRGLVGGMVKTFAKTMLGPNVREIPAGEWPESIKASGFCGTAIHMSEPVFDIPSVVRSLVAVNPGGVRGISRDDRVDPCVRISDGANQELSSVCVDDTNIVADRIIFTCALGNEDLARAHHHDQGLETQARPLLMGMIRGAPFPLFAHLVATSEKPVATITTHTDRDGKLVWYVGGQVAERAKDSDPRDVFRAMRKALMQYLPGVDLSDVEWGTFPIDRSEGKSKSDDWLPDTPTIHAVANALYCWPTKLAFAPLLADRIVEQLERGGVKPSHRRSDWSFLPSAPFAEPPWNEAVWTSER